MKAQDEAAFEVKGVKSNNHASYFDLQVEKYDFIKCGLLDMMNENSFTIKFNTHLSNKISKISEFSVLLFKGRNREGMGTFIFPHFSTILYLPKLKKYIFKENLISG